MSNKLRHFLRRLVSTNITIILKDDTVIEGKCTAVDSLMNVHLRSVSEIQPNGKRQTLESYTVRGNQILWIEFAESINIDYLV